MAIDAPAMVVNPSSAAMKPDHEKNKRHVKHDAPTPPA